MGTTPKRSTERLLIPAKFAGRLAVYATQYYRVLAPRGWRCAGGEGEDGSAYLEVRPKSGTTRSVTYEDGGACYGCILDLVCPLFPAAARLEASEYGLPCPRPKPPRETTHRDGHVVWFKDPAGVAGTGDNSGGGYAAVGAVQYQGGLEGSGTKVTCVLPIKDRKMCNVIIRDEIGRVASP